MNYIDISSKINKDPSITEPVKKGEDAIDNSLRNILMTSPNTVPGHPEFGCNMSRFLFDLLDPLTEQLIEEEISYALKRWEPRVTITNVLVKNDPDYNRTVISITYTIVSDPENIAREYIFKVEQK